MLAYHSELSSRYGTIRNRLFNPPNAVEDEGIDLKRKPVVAQEVKRKQVVDKNPPIAHDCHVLEYYKHVHEQKVLALYTKVIDTTERTLVEDIIKQTAAAFGVRPADILGPRRDRNSVAARHMAMARAYVERPDMTLPELGRLFKRDHTVLLHAAKKMGVWNGADARAIKTISGLQRRYGALPFEGATAQ